MCAKKISCIVHTYIPHLGNNSVSCGSNNNALDYDISFSRIVHFATFEVMLISVPGCVTMKNEN